LLPALKLFVHGALGLDVEAGYAEPNWPASSVTERFKRVPFRDTSVRRPLLSRTRYDHLLATTTTYSPPTDNSLGDGADLDDLAVAAEELFAKT
jgi:hypothetical protein